MTPDGIVGAKTWTNLGAGPGPARTGGTGPAAALAIQTIVAKLGASTDTPLAGAWVALLGLGVTVLAWLVAAQPLTGR